MSLHCPATADTIAFVNQELLSRMKPTALLLNISRGSLLNEADVANALNAGLIAGAELDVLAIEPPVPHNPLIMAKNCLVTPHTAWASLESCQRLMHLVVDNIRAFLDGSPINTVS